MKPYLCGNVNYQDALIMEFSHITTNQKKTCRKFYILNDSIKVIYRIADHFQQPKHLDQKVNENGKFCKVVHSKEL